MVETNSWPRKSNPLFSVIDWALRIFGSLVGSGIVCFLLLIRWENHPPLFALLSVLLFVSVTATYLLCCAVVGRTFENVLTAFFPFAEVSSLKSVAKVFVLLGEGFLSPLIVVVETVEVISVFILFMLVVDKDMFDED